MNRMKGKTNWVSWNSGRVRIPCVITSVQVAVFILCALAAPGLVHGTDFSVSSVEGLISAINDANDEVAYPGPDMILLEPVAYTLNAVDNDTDGANGLPCITSNITIIGQGADTTIIERDDSGGAPAFRILCVAEEGDLTLENVTIRGGFAQHIFGTTSDDGGGIFNRGTLTITDSTVRANNASSDGGGIYSSGTLTITDSSVGTNNASWEGGGIYNSGTMTVTDSTVNGNDTSQESGSGGGICSSGTMTIASGTVSGNEALMGGGISNFGTLTLTNSTVNGNVASWCGGGIFNHEGTIRLTNSTVSRNVARDGGGIENWATMTVTNSTVSGNVADDYGGIYSSDTMTITDSTVNGNETLDIIGGILNIGTMTITNSTVNGNEAVWTGGILNCGAITLTNSTVSGNRADHDGGGIYAFSEVNLNNVTITNNTADADEDGVGDGGGIFIYEGATVNLKNTIIAGNFDSSSDPDCYGTLTSQGYNLIQTISENCVIVGDITGNIIGVAPNLAPLADNGGSTQTHALLPGSAAIDAGNPAGCTDDQGNLLTTDQRGELRPQDGNGDGQAICDIGAFELGEEVDLPDLTITDIFNSECWRQNQEVLVTAMIENLGEADVSGSYKVRLYIEGMECDPLAETELADIPWAGSTEPISFSFTAPYDLQPGEYTLYALVDADGEIQEEDEANNFATTRVVIPALGDLDCDGDVDRDDLNIILSHRNQQASECPECDLDGDGMITALDARKLVLLCTRSRCACE